jgi:hypothetical protein
MSEELGTLAAPTTVPLRPEWGQRVVAFTADTHTQQGRAVVLLAKEDAAPADALYGVATWSEREGLVWIEAGIDDFDDARQRFAVWSAEVPER